MRYRRPRRHHVEHRGDRQPAGDGPDPARMCGEGVRRPRGVSRHPETLDGAEAGQAQDRCGEDARPAVSVAARRDTSRAGRPPPAAADGLDARARRALGGGVLDVPTVMTCSFAQVGRGRCFGSHRCGGDRGTARAGCSPLPTGWSARAPGARPGRRRPPRGVVAARSAATAPGQVVGGPPGRGRSAAASNVVARPADGSPVIRHLLRAGHEAAAVPSSSASSRTTPLVSRKHE